MDIKLFNIIAVINDGYSDSVVDIAKENGAKGGTSIHATSTVSNEAIKLYGIGIHPEKEIVMTVVEQSMVDKILEALYLKLGLNSKANGVFFALPVNAASENILEQYKDKNKEE